MFSSGLLHESFIPQGQLRELRMVVREREDVIETGSAYINKMQKALELTNGKQYVEQGIKKYEQKLKDRELKLLSTLARKHNFELAEIQTFR